MPQHANRLIHERSPYLRQHAHNPVDWFPWGTEAFEKAAREDRPIFLSIGYSTCHWCHVMAHESFEDPEVGRLLDAAFVPIKVDREERPDIDGIYMTVCQMMTGGGGWPLTILMTPDQRPFFAGTYFPRHSRFGRIGLIELLERVRELWVGQRSHVLIWAQQATEALRRAARTTPGPELAADLLGEARGQLGKRFDEVHGGFGRAPKFPAPHNLLFLLRHWHRTADAGSLAMVERTLQAMRRGGIYDQLGFGFHRYATDEAWRVPHFEKMLYDQALLAMAYAEAYQATRRPEYAATVREILAYVLRDMRSPEGVFYSGEDADSDGVEGKFYVWTHDELAGLLGPEELQLAERLFHVKREGNFEPEAGEPGPGANILYCEEPVVAAAAVEGRPPAEPEAGLEALRARLLAARSARVRPMRDEKVLADWNGLAIAALAKAAQALEEPEYAAAAGRAADVLLEKLRRPDGRLLHRNGAHPPPIPAYADDYAFVIWGLIELYAATFEPGRLDQALALNEQLLAHFWDPDAGGLFFVAADAEQILVRRKEVQDGALPSGNSIAMLNMMRLARLTGRTDLEEKAAVLGSAFSNEVRQAPLAHTMLLAALDYALGPSQEVVLAGRPDAPDTRALVSALRRAFLPRAAVIFRPAGRAGGRIVELAPFARELEGHGERAVAYVCQGNRCGLPVGDPAEMLARLGAEDAGR